MMRILILGCVAIAGLVFAGVHEGSRLEFANVAEKAGLPFVLENSPTAQKFMIETAN